MKFEGLSDTQIKAYFQAKDENVNFIKATAEYMATLSETQEEQMANASKALSEETQAQTGIAGAAKAQQEQVKLQMEEEAVLQDINSGLPSWLSGVFNILVSCVTLDPALVAITAAGFTLQQTGAMDSMIKSICGDNMAAAAGLELGISIGTSLAAGGATGAGLMGKLSNTFAYFGQSLMVTNFWPTFFQSAGLSQSNAMIAGMLVGMTFAIGASLASGGNRLAQLLRDRMTERFGDQFDQYLHNVTLALNTGNSAIQITQGAYGIQAGVQEQALAEFTRNVKASSQASMVTFFGAMTGMSTTLETTENNLSTLAEFDTEENGTFAALAQIFRQPA
jgi:hypothetical protein